VLLACELGGGLGHIDPLLRLARGLAELGHQPVLAVRNLGLAWPKVSQTPFPLMQAPVFYWQPFSGKVLNYGFGYADTLARTGFAAEETLLPMVRAWEELLNLLRPALVIADYSPVLCLTVYRTLPALNVGFGFIVPPTGGAAFPPLLPGKPPFAAEERLLEVVQTVQRRRGHPVPPTLTGAFADAEPFLTVLPELDHYQRVRQEGHLGPMVELLPPQPWPEEARFFAYLKATNPATPTILAALAQTGFLGQAFVLGADPQARIQLARPGLEVLDSPPPLNEVLPRVRVVVHHGGINLAQQALAAGRPQLVFPEHLEATLTAVQLHRLGVAHYMKDQFPPRTIAVGMRELLTDSRFGGRARQLAEQVHVRGPWDPLPKILARCRELLG
jgi:hypothetical protein